jgi:NAD(P)H dehydrogenase (quinone)
MYSITGITGKVGSAIAENLLKINLPVTAVIRDSAKAEIWKEKGAAVAIADLNDTEGIFVMTPPLWHSNDPMGEHNKMLTALTAAIEKARPIKIVYLSSVGGQLTSGTGAIHKLYDLEQAMKKLDIPTVGIRAAWFMENFIGSIPEAQNSGILPSFLERTAEAIAMIGTADIGALAAALLQETWAGHRIIELEGPSKYSPDDIAKLLSRNFNKQILAKAILDSDFDKTYLSFGFTLEGSQGMSAMIRGFNRGTLVFEGREIEHVIGNTTLEQVLNPHLS